MYWVVVDYDVCVCCVVGDCVEYFVWLLGVGVDWLVVCVDDFECGYYVVDCVVYVEDCVVWVGELFVEYECEFDFDVWYDEVVGWDCVVVCEEYVVE